MTPPPEAVDLRTPERTPREGFQRNSNEFADSYQTSIVTSV
jgi:hypothetical protein